MHSKPSPMTRGGMYFKSHFFARSARGNEDELGKEHLRPGGGLQTALSLDKGDGGYVTPTAFKPSSFSFFFPLFF